VPLFPWLFQAKERNFKGLPAFGAGNMDGYRLPHYPFGNGSDHGVNVVQSLVKHIQSLVNAVNISLGVLSQLGGFPVLRQTGPP
jgi:hypothetical protein